MLECRGAIRWVWRVLVAGLLLSACATESPSPSPTVGQEDAEAATVLFVEDFSTARTTQWALFDTDVGAAYIQRGELYLEDRGANTAVYTPLLGQAWEDVRLHVRVRQVEGTFNNWMGVLCRQQDEENYYLFAISADGYYLLLRVVDGLATPLAGPTASDAIEVGRATNVMVVTCQGDYLSMMVNDDYMVARTDAELPGGGVALFVDAVEGRANTTVAFSRLEVYQP